MIMMILIVFCKEKEKKSRKLWRWIFQKWNFWNFFFHTNKTSTKMVNQYIWILNTYIQVDRQTDRQIDKHGTGFFFLQNDEKKTHTHTKKNLTVFFIFYFLTRKKCKINFSLYPRKNDEESSSSSWIFITTTTMMMMTSCECVYRWFCMSKKKSGSIIIKQHRNHNRHK